MRLEALRDAGGWDESSIVEDTDLSLILYCGGWDSLYLPHVECDNELPGTYRTFMKQQRRWTAGPVSLLTSRHLYSTLRSSKISFSQKTAVIWFFARLLVPLVNFVFVVGVLPVRLVLLDNQLWAWFYIFPAVLLILSIFSATPEALTDCIPYCMFEIGFSLYRFKHCWTGLLHLRHSKTWLVTQKLGVGRTASTASLLSPRSGVAQSVLSSPRRDQETAFLPQAPLGSGHGVANKFSSTSSINDPHPRCC